MTDAPTALLRRSEAAERARVAERAARSRSTDDDDDDDASAPRRPASASRAGSLPSTATTRDASSDSTAVVVDAQRPIAAIVDAARRRAEYREASNDALSAPALGLASSSSAAAAMQRVIPDGSDGSDASCELSLRPDEVIAVIGCTPPRAKYFGLTPYLHRVYQAGSVRTAFASLGDSLSAGVAGGFDGDDSRYFTRLSTAAGTVPRGGGGVLRGVDCFDRGFAALFGLSRTTLDRAADALASSGAVPGGAAAINSYGLSTQNGGLLTSYDAVTHAVLLRHAVAEDERLWDAFANDPPFVVLRLTPRRAPMFLRPFPRASLIPRETLDERPLLPAVTAVASAVASHFSSVGDFVTTQNTGAQILFDNGQQCIDTTWNCGGDNRDTTYIRGPTFRIPSNDVVVYVVGVNHATTGNAHYANLAVYNQARNLGVVAVDDASYENTAVEWLRGTVYEDDAPSLYAVAFARTCPDGARRRDVPGLHGRVGGRMPDGTLCVEVPATGFPSAAADEDLVVMERPYNTLGTTVGPEWNTLALPVVVTVRRNSLASALDTF